MGKRKKAAKSENKVRAASTRTVRRKDIAIWQPRLRKRKPAQLLAESTHDRVTSLLGLKAQRMSLSAFAYFRGAAAVMAYDLSLGPNTGIVTQLCGDAHVQNLGAYAGDDGRLTFDINDFDETLCGPFEWDVKRMATSLLLAGADAGIPMEERRGCARAFLSAYCGLLRHLSQLPVLDVARYQVHRLRSCEAISVILGQAERSTPLHLRDKLTEIVDGRRIFRTQKPELWRVEGDEREAVLASLAAYARTLAPERQHFFARLQPLDVAFKVVGTGSVGMRDYCVLMEGNGADDPVFLQIKQETQSVYGAYLPKAEPPAHNGERVVHGQRAMQLQSDPLLGWTTLGGRDFLVRQLNDHKATLDVTTLESPGLMEYAHVCGEMLARGHARSGNPTALAEYVGGGKRFAESMITFAEAYAMQTTADYKMFLRTHKHGKK